MVSSNASSLSKRISLAVACVAVAYFALPVVLLRFALDSLLFPKVNGGPTHEDHLADIPVAADRSILIRQYGKSEQCVIFFPGQHGGISTYERTLFPAIRQAGAAIYALSYAGQDGALGRSRRDTILKDTAVALAAISRESTCQPNNAVFVGRSLGATLAAYAAQRTPPKGILLDGVGMTLTDAVRAALDRHTITRLWAFLPLRRLVQDDFALLPIVRSLRTVPIVIFQGTDDQVVPFVQAQAGLGHERNVRFLAVKGAAHDTAYLVSQREYVRQLAELLAR